MLIHVPDLWEFPLIKSEKIVAVISDRKIWIGQLLKELIVGYKVLEGSLSIWIVVMLPSKGWD